MATLPVTLSDPQSLLHIFGTGVVIKLSTQTIYPVISLGMETTPDGRGLGHVTSRYLISETRETRYFKLGVSAW